jgi:hypothetical protein
MSKIKSVQVTNLRQIVESRADFNGCTAIVIGGNNKGKTTFIRALMDRIRNGKYPDIVKHGEVNGEYVMELTTGEKIIWALKDGGEKEKLTLITERGISTSLTKDYMKHYFPKVFDVDTYMNEAPAEQTKMLLKLCDVDLTDVNKKIAAAEEERTYVGRLLSTAQAARIKFEPTWQLEPRPVEALEKEYFAVEQHNTTYKSVEDGVNTRLANVSNLQKHIEQSVTEIGNLRIQIAKYEELIQADQEKIFNTNLEIEKGNSWLEDEKNKPKTADDQKALQEKIKDAKLNNEATRKEEEWIKQRDAHEKIEKEVKQLRSDRDDAIKASTMPEGFTIDDDGVKYNGFAFDRKNLSSSSTYIGALKLACMTLGEVKAITFDASYLDKNSLTEVCDWAEQNNLQLLIERPDWDGGEIKYELIEQKPE